MVWVGGVGCKDKKDRKENIKRNKLKTWTIRCRTICIQRYQHNFFDRTHKHFLTKWSFGNRENWANFLYKKCFFLLFYSFYVKITQFPKVSYTIQNPPGRVFFFCGCSVLHEPLKTTTEHLYVYFDVFWYVSIWTRRVSNKTP